MPDYRNKLAKITWGAAFANTLRLGYPLDNARTGDEPRAGSVVDQAPSGVEDAWEVGIDYLLTFDARYIPLADTVSPVATGWDGAAGFRAFLAWARGKQLFRFYPDNAAGTYFTSYLVEPMKGSGELEGDGTRKIAMTIRNSAAVAFDGY